ncbi:MAG: Na/Pi cotransporter family protein [Candidatus Riflebacteria bacterium]
MLSKNFKKNCKLFIKWSAVVCFIFIYFYLHYQYGKDASKTFSLLSGGLGMFLYGMNMMSSSLQRIAGNRLKAIVASLTGNPIAGMLTGLGVTALIQSSSATTVMTVGFVNAGIMTLKQAVGIILGANIGTTVTAQLIAFKLTDLAWPILAIGSAMIMFSKSRKNRSWGETLLGFSLLFLGMEFMGSSLKAYREHESFKQIFILLSHNRFYGVLAGLMVTLIVQSSSATVGLTMSLMASGAFGEDPYLALKAAIPIILGDNIGTCITAVLAAIGTTRNAQRAALVHTLFNVFGTIIVLPFLDPYASLMMKTSGDSVRQVANSHTFFNIANALLFLPLTGLLERASMLILPKNDDDNQMVTNLDKRLLATPPIAIAQAEQQLNCAIDIVKKKFFEIDELLAGDEQSIDEIAATIGKVDSLHRQRDQINKDLNKFLIALAQKDLSEDLSRQITRSIYLNKDLEIISSQLHKLLAGFLDMAEDNLKFTKAVREELHICLSKTAEVFSHLTGKLSINEKEAEQIKQIIYSQTLVDHAARDNHLERIKSGQHDPIEGIAFLDALRSISSMLSSMQYFCEHLQYRF